MSKKWYVVLCCESGYTKHDVMYETPQEVENCWSAGETMWICKSFTEAKNKAISFNLDGIREMQSLNKMLRKQRKEYY